jgi:hypothetical protein
VLHDGELEMLNPLERAAHIVGCFKQVELWTMALHMPTSMVCRFQRYAVRVIVSQRGNKCP